MSAPAPSMFSPQATEMAKSLGLKQGRANLEQFADTLTQLARQDRHILAVTSDSRGSGKLGPYGQELPDQIVEVGIAEQNLVGVAAGLASCGKKVFAVSPACFLATRALEQIKNDVCYSDMPVALIGISAGVSYGALGTTHHSLHDFAALRAINNLSIIAPGDNGETRMAIEYAARSDRPVYIRFGKAPLYDLPASEKLTVGQARVVRNGSDLAFIATGETVIHALLAAEHLAASHQIQARVISLHTLRPLDTDAILQTARKCQAVVTVEEHMVHGGLGESVAGLLMQAGTHPRFRIVGIPDEYTVTGAQADIFRHYGISMEGLSQTARQLLA